MPTNLEYGNEYHFGILKMSSRLFGNNPDYTNKLDFWRALEKRYFIQRQKWLEANSQMLAAKLSAEKARKDYEIEKRNKKDEIDDEVEEFSDVDQEGFADPGAIYYSSLDADALQKVKDDLTAIHLRRDSEANVDSRGSYRRLVFAVNLMIVLFCVAVYWLLKVMTNIERTTERQPCPGCMSDVDVPLRGLLNALFPPSNESDEI